MSKTDLTKWIVEGRYYIYCNSCRKFTPHGENEFGLEMCLICRRIHRTRYLKEWLNWDFANEYQFNRMMGRYFHTENLFDVS